MPRVKALVDGVLKQLGVGPEALFSTLGRVAARGIETLVLAEKMDDWVDGLAANMASGELRIHDNSKWDPSLAGRPMRSGAGFHEAPRGALGHWVHITDGTIANYQCVVPSTWNAGPRDAQGTARACTRRRCSARRSPTPSGRSRSCARCTRSIRAWRAASTSSTPRGARSRA